MQRPVIKDGIVVNIVEIDESTAVVTKARHRELSAEEDARYAEQYAEWREKATARRLAIRDAKAKAVMAAASLAALKERAAGETKQAEQAKALKAILAIEKDAIALQNEAERIAAQPFKAKPRMERAKRWFHSDDVEVGPAGGNIGDLWDGEKYVRLTKTEPANV